MPLKLNKKTTAKKEVTPKETQAQIRARAQKKKPRERTATENAAMPAVAAKPTTAKKPNAFTAKAKSGRVKKPSAWAKKSPEVAPKKPNAFTARAKAKVNTKLDFTNNGLKFHNCRQRGSYWTVDVANGDQTITLQNRYSSWMSMPDSLGVMKDPPSWVAAACQRRWHEELKSRGMPTPEQRRLEREAAALAERRKEAAKAEKKDKKKKDKTDDEGED